MKKPQFLLPRFYMKENTPENIAKLKSGHQYLVFYHDCHTGKQEAVAAVWNPKKVAPADCEPATLDKLNLFNFCGYQFVNNEVCPSFEYAEGRHHIVAWCDLNICGVAEHEEQTGLDFWDACRIASKTRRRIKRNYESDWSIYSVFAEPLVTYESYLLDPTDESGIDWGPTSEEANKKIWEVENKRCRYD